MFQILSTFKGTMYLHEKTKRLKLTLLPKQMSNDSVQVTLDKGSVPYDVKRAISEGNVELVVFYAKNMTCSPTTNRTKDSR